MLVVCLELRAEVEKLKQLNAGPGNDDVILESRREVAFLREQLMIREAEMNDMKRSVALMLRYIVTVNVSVLSNRMISAALIWIFNISSCPVFVPGTLFYIPGQ